MFSKINNRNESELVIDYFLGVVLYKRIIFLIPDKLWSSLVMADVTLYVIEGLDQCWRANRSCDMGEGAKDSSNNLVAGSCWNVPKNSRPINNSIVL